MHSVRKGGTTYAYGALAGDAAHVKIMDLMQAKRLEVRTIHMLRIFMLTHVWLRACLHANLSARPLIFFHSCAQSIALHDSAGFMPLSWQAEGPEGRPCNPTVAECFLTLVVCLQGFMLPSWLEAEGAEGRQRKLEHVQQLLADKVVVPLSGAPDAKTARLFEACKRTSTNSAVRDAGSASWSACSLCWQTYSWCRCQVGFALRAFKFCPSMQSAPKFTEGRLCKLERAAAVGGHGLGAAVRCAAIFPSKQRTQHTTKHPPHNLVIWSACSSCWQTGSFRRCQVRQLNNVIHPRKDCAGARQQGWAGEKPVVHFEQLLAYKVMMPLSGGSNNIAPSRGMREQDCAYWATALLRCGGHQGLFVVLVLLLESCCRTQCDADTVVLFCRRQLAAGAGGHKGHHKHMCFWSCS